MTEVIAGEAMLARARAELDAAFVLLLSAEVPLELVAPHTKRCWDEIRALRGSTSHESTADWLANGNEPTLEEAAREDAARLVEHPAQLSRDGALAQAQKIREVLEKVEQEVFGRKLADRRKAQAKRTGKKAGWIAAPILAYLVFWPLEWREGPWRAEYYENMDLAGEPRIRRDSDVSMVWKDEGPYTTMEPDEFSVRWDTCMKLETGEEMEMVLTSDDGSRLFIDGNLLIDNWGIHSRREMRQPVTLSAGVHHVRVEYFEHKKDARVELKASFAGEKPDSIPTRLLTYPGDALDENDPCKNVE